MLHLRCGDDILDRLRSVVPGDVVRWADPLCEGPLTRWSDATDRRQSRAAYLAERYGQSYASVLADLETDDRGFCSASEHDELILWFEADLYDQAILVHLLARHKEIHPKTRWSLICVGSHPAVSRFTGLGQLSADALGALFPNREPILPETFRHAREVWDALASGETGAIEQAAGMECASLSFLGSALERYLAERPWGPEALGQTRRWVIEAIAGGARTVPDAFSQVQLREDRPWLGDSMFLAILADLARCDPPWLLLPAGFPWGLESPGEVTLQLAPRVEAAFGRPS